MSRERADKNRLQVRAVLVEVTKGGLRFKRGWKKMEKLWVSAKMVEWG